MDATWLDLAGVSVHEPAYTAENVLLALQRALCARGLAKADAKFGQWWRGFFAAMAVATAAGALKHGFPHALWSGVYATVLWTSNLTGGAAVHFAQRATIAARARGRLRRPLEWAAYTGTAVFLATCLVTGPHVDVLIACHAIGLLPVLGAVMPASPLTAAPARRVREEVRA